MGRNERARESFVVFLEMKESCALIAAGQNYSFWSKYSYDGCIKSNGCLEKNYSVKSCFVVAETDVSLLGKIIVIT